MIVATFDDLAHASPQETTPSLLNYFLEEVMDGTVTDSSSDTAKNLDATGCSPYYINPVNSVMLLRARSQPHDDRHVQMAPQDDRRQD